MCPFLLSFDRIFLDMPFSLWPLFSGALYIYDLFCSRFWRDSNFLTESLSLGTFFPILHSSRSWNFNIFLGIFILHHFEILTSFMENLVFALIHWFSFLLSVMTLGFSGRISAERLMEKLVFAYHSLNLFGLLWHRVFLGLNSEYLFWNSVDYSIFVILV